MDEPRVYKAEFLYLTTTGHKTGQPHEIEIWYVPHESCYYLIAEGRDDAHWVKNIRHNQQVRFWVLGQVLQGTGRIITPEVEPALAATIAALMDAKYQWSDGLIVELCPT